MKRIYIVCMLMLALSFGILSACGGGGGGGGTNTVTQPTTAVLTLSTAVTGTIPSDTVIAGYDITVDLPAGVTAASSTPPQADASVVTPSGSAVGAPVAASYVAATSSTPGKLHVIIVSNQSTGFSAGEFCKVTFNIAAGTYPAASDFPRPVFTASGLKTNTDTVDLTTELALTVTTVIN